MAAFFSDNENDIESILQINQTFQDDAVEIEKLIERGNLDTNPRLSLKRAVIRNAFLGQQLFVYMTTDVPFVG